MYSLIAISIPYQTEKSNTSIFSPVKHVQLNKQITTLTEDIEELKTRKNHLMHEVGCQNDAEMKQAEGKLSKMTNYLEKMKVQQSELSSQLAVDEKNFAEIRAQSNPETDSGCPEYYQYIRCHGECRCRPNPRSDRHTTW